MTQHFVCKTINQPLASTPYFVLPSVVEKKNSSPPATTTKYKSKNNIKLKLVPFSQDRTRCQRPMDEHFAESLNRRMLTWGFYWFVWRARICYGELSYSQACYAVAMFWKAAFGKAFLHRKWSLCFFGENNDGKMDKIKGLLYFCFV